MTEYIEREDAVNAVMAAKWVNGSDGAMAMEIVASPPAADVAPVVRCKDCKHRGGVSILCNGTKIDYCKVWDGTVQDLESTFCSYGEYQTNGGTANA